MTPTTCETNSGAGISDGPLGSDRQTVSTEVTLSEAACGAPWNYEYFPGDRTGYDLDTGENTTTTTRAANYPTIDFSGLYGESNPHNASKSIQPSTLFSGGRSRLEVNYSNFTLLSPCRALGGPIKMAVIGGGGADSFIARHAHIPAARATGEYELVGGVFSRTAERSTSASVDFAVQNKSRVYSSIEELIKAENSRDRNDRIGLVVVATPNGAHYPQVKALLEGGFNVICEKPLCTTLAQARELLELAESKQSYFALAHNYPFNPMVVQAMRLIDTGKIGKVDGLHLEYVQGWLRTSLEAEGQKQAAWRCDPNVGGAVGSVGDIGTHAFDMACRLIGKEPLRVRAQLSTAVSSRMLDDNAHIFVDFGDDLIASIRITQTELSGNNRFTFSVSGTEGAINWNQEISDSLTVCPRGKPKETWEKGAEYIDIVAKSLSMLPAGHQAGYIGSFVGFYKNVASDICKHKLGVSLADSWPTPNMRDGYTEMAFIDAVLKSARQDFSWQNIELPWR